MKLFRILFWVSLLCAALAAGFILFNGTQHAGDSNSRSDVITEVVEDVLKDTFRVDPVVHDDVSYFVRKAAHVTEYLLFGLFCGLAAFFARLCGHRLEIFLPVSLVLLLGITDEFLQSFSDRTSQVGDVLFDGAGGIIGILLAALVYALVRRGARKKKKESV